MKISIATFSSVPFWSLFAASTILVAHPTNVVVHASTYIRQGGKKQQQQQEEEIEDHDQDLHGHRYLASTVLVNDNFDGNPTTFDPSDPSSEYFYFATPGLNDANDGILVQNSNSITRTIVPHTSTVGLGGFGTVDHIKNLQYHKQYFVPSATESILCELKMGGTMNIPTNLPFPTGSIDKPNDDIRLGSVSMNILDAETFIVADFFLTNTGIWVLNERLPFGWGIPELNPPGGVYAAYSQVKRIRSRSPNDIHKFGIEYDKSTNSIRWYIEDEQVAETNTLGTPDPSFTTVLDHGGIPQPVQLNGIQCGWGQFTLLDFADPNNLTAAQGLVKLVDTPNFYVSPTTFVDELSQEENRLFGQGTTQTVKRFKAKIQPGGGLTSSSSSSSD